MIRFKKLFIFLSIFVLGLLLHKFYYKTDPIFTFKSELWADRSGYYVYLPMYFVYDMDAAKMPAGIEEKVGSAFWKVDGGKIFTKYPIGVSYFEAPFYGLFTMRDQMKGDNVNDGFTRRQHIGVLWAGVFWGVVGFFFLYHLLCRYASWKTALAATLCVVLGSNLWYYWFVEPGMSHIFSFMLITLLCWLIVKWKDKSYQSFRHAASIALCLGLIIAVRQLNVIFAGLIILFFENYSLDQILERVKAMFKPLNLLAFIIIPLMVMAPQMAYYYYLSGKLYLDTYQGEGFTFLTNPQIKEVLFAPQNGWYLYSPLMLIVTAGLVYMFVKKAANRWVYASVLLLVLYSYAAWHCWYLGCSFGGRGFVDFSVIFALILTWLFVESQDWNKKYRNWFYGLVAFFVIVSIRLTWSHNFCYFGEGTWDWNFYFSMVTKH